MGVPKHNHLRGDIIPDIYFFETYKLFQTDGNKSHKIEIDYNNTKFYFHEIKDENTIHFNLYKNNNDEEKPECVIIIIDKIEKIATLHGIMYDKTCCSNIKKLCSGTLLLKLAIKFVKFLGEKIKLKYLELRDNSYKICHNIQIKMPLFYTLMYGDTWYGKHGFLPFSHKEEKIDYKLLKDYKNNIKIINSVKTKDVKKLKDYLVYSYKKVKPNIKFEEIAKIYNKYYDHLLSDFLKEYLFNYDTTCKMFNWFIDKLAHDINIHNFYGETFVYYLN